MGEDIVRLDGAGFEAQRVSGAGADAVRVLLTRRHATRAEMGASEAVIAEMLDKGFVDVVHIPSRRGVITAGAVGVTALALPSRLAAESVGGSGGVAPQIPGAPTNLSAVGGVGAIQISFTPGVDGGAEIVGYEYTTDNGLTWHAVTPATTTSPVTITRVWNSDLDDYEPLTSGTTYNVRLRAVNADGESGEVGSPSATVSGTTSSTQLTATGGEQDLTVTEDRETFAVHVFSTSADFVLNQATDLEYLVVGGGGAGGGAKRTSSVNRGGGGGGAGGMRTGTFLSLTAATYSVVVGAGGTTNDLGNNGNSGAASSFNNITSAGGGGGGSAGVAGVSGGSGGGGGPRSGSSGNGLAGGNGNTPSVSPPQGNAGGTGGTTAGAGGGGAGASGVNANMSTSGSRGEGLSSSITGEAVTYARGGDGGNVGGTPARSASGPGGGGGGGGYEGTQTSSPVLSASQGNAGIVVLRYRVVQPWDTP